MKKALKIAVNVILWVFVAFSAMTMVLSLSSAASDGVPSIFGKSLISIQSDSMKPTFKEGDLLFVKPLKGVDRMTLKKDDVITFWADLDGDGNQELNTHRIVEVI
ncbi:MAG: S26 family signal peptidase, partial [Firmicutes bacterium]|nr:S26 family signal peptidase [Bacillota bacterium]